MLSDRAQCDGHADFVRNLLPLMSKIYGVALNMTKDPWDAEDLAQGTYLRAWRFYHRFRKGSNFEAWIFRILINNFINHYRREQRKPHREDFEIACKSMTAGEDPTVEKEFPMQVEKHAEFFDDKITEALDHLSEKYRLAVLLADVAEMNYKEIAEQKKCPIGTVMSRVHRGRKELARLLKSRAVELGYI